ncbi:MAG TPA: DUF4340 domain-containing protein [Gammaproteobacteria bacterium]|nr:DUF4340 domain-containing protein [Gammaproteobacteria bacterium]
MRARWWLNLALLALVAVLAAVAWYQPGKQPPHKSPPLTTLEPDQVTHIHVTRPGDKALTLVKRNGHWRMTAPFDLRANAVRINGLLRLCTTTSQRSFAYKPAKAAEYGLDHPRATVRLNDTEIVFGGSQPVNHHRYVRIGDRIHLITDHMTYYLLSRATAFIDLSPLGPDDHPVGFDLPGGVTLSAKDGHWHAQPAKALTSTDAVAALLQHWRDAHAIEIRNYPPEKQKAQSGERVSIRLDGDKAPLHFDVVSKKPELILGRRDIGIEYVLPADSAEHLLQLQSPKSTSSKPPRSPAGASAPPAS